MASVQAVLAQWQLDSAAVRERIARATTPRERERWHALWLWSRGGTGVQVAEALGRDAHPIGAWVESFCRGGPASVAFSQSAGPPRPDGADLAALDAAVAQSPRDVGVPVANWNWKAVRSLLANRCGKHLARRSCFRALHRLGLVVKRPQKRRLKADAAKRAQFVRDDAQLQREAQASGALISFVDEAHFYADADLHGRWVRKGEPARIDSSSPRYGAKARYYSGVCLETGRAVGPRRGDREHLLRDRGQGTGAGRRVLRQPRCPCCRSTATVSHQLT
ncbi:MAG: winged helix-turn-helix domain-containing protein, partial [Dehalococcoidia bacterium]